MKTLVLIAVSCLLVLSVGCKSLNNSSMTEEMVKRQAATEAVLLKLAEKNSSVVADALASMPQSGAAGCTTIERAVRDPEGNVVKDPSGQVVMEKGQAVGKTQSMRDFESIEEGWLVLGGLARNPKTGEVETGAALDGVFVHMTKVGKSVTSPEFARIWANKTVEEKRAAADAVKVEYEGRKGLLVEGVTAAGDVAKGVLKEVLSATPYGAGLAAVKAIVDVAGKDTPVTVYEPMDAAKATVAK